MTMQDNLNKKLKDIVNQIATIESKSDKGEQLTEAEITAYKSLNAEGVQVRQLIDEAEASAALQAYAKGSAGSVAVKSMSQEFTTPEDRHQEQKAQEAAAKNAYKSAFESYLIHGMKMGENDKKILREGALKAGEAMKVLTEGNAVGGGFLVPEQFQAEVLKQEPGLIGLRENVRVQPTSRDVVVWPIIRYSNTSNTYTAPHRLTWTGEIPAAATTARVTDQSFGEVRIPINLAMASQLISNTLVEDSAVDVLALTATLFRENIMQDIEAALCSGSGIGQPEGLFTNGQARARCVVTNNAAQITTGGLVNQYWSLPAQYRRNAKWLMSSNTAYQVASLVDANARFMWQAGDMFGGGLGSTQQDGSVVINPRLLGMPLVISDQAPTMTTNAYCIAFGDLRSYILAERIGMTVRVLDELYAETDQKLYLLRYRAGGQLAEDYKVRLNRCQA